MRYADPGDCEEMAQAQEAFFTELSKYLSLSRSLSKNQEWSKPHKNQRFSFLITQKQIALYKITAKEVLFEWSYLRGLSTESPEKGRTAL